MYFREFSVGTNYKLEFGKKFNLETWCICEMFWYQLRKMKTKSLMKLALRLSDVPTLSYIETYGNVYSENLFFDFEDYFNKNSEDKKKIILDIIYYKLLELAPEQELDLIKSAYNYCIINNYKNIWLLRDKYVKSKKLNLYGAIECNWDIDFFKATAIICDKNKNIIKKQEILKIEPHMGDFVYYCKMEWDDNIFKLKSSDQTWQVVAD